jgi:hypothetical protein
MKDNTKNRLSDLNDHLFMQIERLNDEDLQGEALDTEIRRCHAVCAAASQVVAAGRLVLDASKAADQLPGIKKQRILLE